MRVALLGPGSSTHTIKWVNGLAQRGVETHLISVHEASPEIHSAVKVHKIGLPPPLGYFFGSNLRKILNQIKPDLLNVHGASGYGQLARLSRFHPTLLSVWGSDVYDFPYNGFFQKWILVKNLKHADAIASTSHAMKRQVQKFSADKQVFVTPFGVDEKRFTPKAKADSKPVVIGTVKLLESEYGIDILIQAFAKVYKTLVAKDSSWSKGLKLLIVGDGKKREELETMVAAAGIKDVTEFRGFVPQAKVPDCLSELDVYVALSRKESFGVAILEASACGIPVLVSDADGPAEITVNNVTGIIVPRENVNVTAENLTKLVLNSEMRKRLGEAGRVSVVNQYTWDHSLDVMIETYKKVIHA